MKKILALAAFAAIATAASAAVVTVQENNFSAAQVGAVGSATFPSNLVFASSNATPNPANTAVKAAATAGVPARTGGTGYVLDIGSKTGSWNYIVPASYASMTTIGNQRLTFYGYVNLASAGAVELSYGGQVARQGTIISRVGYSGIVSQINSTWGGVTFSPPAARSSFLLAYGTAWSGVNAGANSVADGWHKFTVELQNGTLRLLVDDVQVSTGTSTTYTTGYCAVCVYADVAGDAAKFVVDAIKFENLNAPEPGAVSAATEWDSLK